MSPEIVDAKKLLDELRWTADRIITNYAGDRVWLKSITYKDIEGKDRHGVTDCCPIEWPCDYHARLTHEAMSSDGSTK